MLIILLTFNFWLIFPSAAELPPGSDTMTFTSGEKVTFSSNVEMTVKSTTQMTFRSNITMKFGTGIRIQFMAPSGIIQPCDTYNIVSGLLPAPCSWWELIDQVSGKPTGIEFHVDWADPPALFHIDLVMPGPTPVNPELPVTAELKVDSIAPCDYFVVHWPEHWWPLPCSWWEIIWPIEWSGIEFHVDWTNESCEFHIDQVIPETVPPLEIPVYEVIAVQKIEVIEPCDYFVVEDPPDWYPLPCSWWEILDPDTGTPTGYEFHVDWTNESCEFHIDQVTPEPYILPYPVPRVVAQQKIIEIAPCDWLQVVDPLAFIPDPCTWWEVIDDVGNPTGLEFHVDISYQDGTFHTDQVLPGPSLVIPWGPSYTLRVRKKIDIIQPCDWFIVDDPALTPEPCSWWKITDPYLGLDIEFHVDESAAGGIFHIDQVLPGPIEIPPSYNLTAERKIDNIQPCDWFKVLDPSSWVPEPCSWWRIVWPIEWAGIYFHVDANDGIGMFHIDKVEPDLPPPPIPPPWNVTAEPSEPPPKPWYMKPPYPDYAPNGMPDFDQRQWGTYNWTNGGLWSHCGPVAVANSLWWLDSEFEKNTTPPPKIVDTYPLVQSYQPSWDDHDPQNVPPLVEHLAWLMDTDGRRTGLLHYGTNVFDMQAGITHYLSWSGVNPLGDVDGDGNVTSKDVAIVQAAIGATPGTPGWDLRADIWPETVTGPYTADNIIDNNDLSLVQANLGATGQFYEHTIIAPLWETIVEEVEKCQDVVLLIAPWYYDENTGTWYRSDEDAHFVTVAGINGTTWEIVLSDPIRDNAEAGGSGDVPVTHPHLPPEPPYTTHNNASLVSHDAYNVTIDPCPGGPLTIVNYPCRLGPYPIWRVQIEAAVITSPYAIHDIAVTNLTSCYGSTILTQNYTYNVNITVTNEGSAPETFTLTIYWNLTHVINSTTVSLNIGETKVVQLQWNTTGYQRYANYTLSAHATPVPGEIDTTDNTFIDARSMVMTYPGDINADKKIDIVDVANIAALFGVNYPDPRYNPNCDITCDGKIDIVDVATSAISFGYIEP